MPTVALKKEDLFKKLGKTYTDEEFDELCFEFGLELDEITSEKEMIAKEQGADKAVGACDDVIFKIEVPANRYDLLCMEGLTRGLMIFLERMRAPMYHCLKLVSPLKISATKECLQIRPFVVAAVLRNITFTPERYASFIDLQDKLHQNICRKRSLTAIGTHDLDTIEPPFLYDARPPEAIRFKPLGQEKEYTAAELMELYSKDSHLKPYLGLIRDSPVYPVIYDSKGVVLSMPPIINGEHSKIRLETKNVLIECTATDLHKASIVLDTLVTMFSEYCATPFTVEAMDVEAADGTHHCYPTLESRRYSVPLKYITSRVGVPVSVEESVHLLERMGLRAFPAAASHAGAEEVEVCVPPTRHDILHPCDIMEDVAVAYGFNRIPERRPQAYGTAFDQPLNKLSDLLRVEMAAAGFTECLTFSLCSRDDVSKNLRHSLEDRQAVHIANPKTQEFQVIRTTLLPGILRTMDANQHLPPPLKLFEIQDIVMKDASKDVGSRNQRHLCAVYCHRTAGFEIMHGILDRIMLLLEVKPAFLKSGARDEYFLRPLDDATFLKNQSYSVHAKGQKIGVIGVLHPEVVEAFKLKRPCSCLEIDIEPFM